jgi:hypothetical protein
VWLPKYVASVIISLNQKDIEHIKTTKAKNKKFSAKLKLCMVNTNEVVSDKRLILVKTGQGEGLTK